MDEKMRIVDLVNNPTPALAAECFYRMYPDDYTWRRYGTMRTRGWSSRESRETGNDEGGHGQWRHHGTEACGLMLRVADTMKGLVIPMMDSNPKARAAYTKFGTAGYVRRVILALRALYEQH